MKDEPESLVFYFFWLNLNVSLFLSKIFYYGRIQCYHQWRKTQTGGRS